MAFTNYKTWSAGETLTAANFNQQIRDNGLLMGPHLIARKTGDQSQASGVFGDDTILVLAMGAAEVWHIRLFMNFTTASVAMSFKFPAGSLSITAHHASGHTTWADTSSPASSNVLANGGILVEGFVTAGSAGNFLPYYAGSGGTTTAKANSTLWAVKLA